MTREVKPKMTELPLLKVNLHVLVVAARICVSLLFAGRAALFLLSRVNNNVVCLLFSYTYQ